MIIADTSVWIEFFRGHSPVVEELSGLFQRSSVMGLPWVFGELLQGARNQAEIQVLLRTWEAIPKPELRSSEVAWIRAGEQSCLGKWHAKGLGLIDAAIVAISEEYKAPVWTLDKKLEAVLRFKKIMWQPQS